MNDDKPIIPELGLHQFKEIVRLIKDIEDKLKELKGKLEGVKVQNDIKGNNLV